MKVCRAFGRGEGVLVIGCCVASCFRLRLCSQYLTVLLHIEYSCWVFFLGLSQDGARFYPKLGFPSKDTPGRELFSCH